MCFGGPDYEEGEANKQLRREGVKKLKFHQKEILPLIDDMQERLNSGLYRGAKDSIFGGRANVDVALAEDELFRTRMAMAAQDEAGTSTGGFHAQLAGDAADYQDMRTKGVLAADFAEDASHADANLGLLKSFNATGGKLQQGLMTSAASIQTASELARMKANQASREAISKALGDAAVGVGGAWAGQYQLAKNPSTPTAAMTPAGQMMRGWMGNADPMTDPGTKWGQRGAGLRSWFTGMASGG